MHPTPVLSRLPLAQQPSAGLPHASRSWTGSCAPGQALGPARRAAAAAPHVRRQRRRRRPAPPAASLSPLRLFSRLLQSASPELVQEQGAVEQASSSSSSPDSSSSSSMAQPVDEVYECQRYVGIGWRAPLSPLDWPAWCTADGSPVVLAAPPTQDPAAWELAVNPATDDSEGWQYGTVFRHLEYKRAGGRSSARFGDTVRRRLWRRVRDPAAAASSADFRAVAVPAGGDEGAAAAVAAAAAAGESAAAAAAAAAVRQAKAADASKKAIKAFLALVLDVLSRRQLWTLVPWDPAALFLLARKHQQVYQELREQAWERRLWSAEGRPPPSPLGREGRTLLQDLLCAAMHSRAAYAFPLAAGLMSDVTSYVKLQTVQQLTFDAVGGVSAEANNEAVAQLAGIEPGDLLLAEWRNSPYRPCHYLGIDRANQCIVISIRGSLQVGDLLSDLAAAPMEVKLAGADGWVHQGIMGAATFVHCNTASALEEAARRCPGWPVLITGHSLGGGVAALLSLLLRQSGLPEGLGPLHCITLGTAAVMSRPLAEACNDRVTSVILGSDCIPHLSAASVEALLLEASEESPVRKTVEGWGNKLASTISSTAARQRELADAAAAISGERLAGSWSAVKQASARLGRNASSAGLAKVASLISETASRGVGGGSAAARQIPVIEQQHPPAEQQQQRQRQQQGQRQVPVIDLSSQGAAAATVAAAGVAAAAASAAAVPASHQLEQQQEGDVLMPLADFDASMAEAAAAQEAAAGPLAASSSGSPEHLFPPGHIIWLFPAEEPVVQAAEGQLQAMEEAWLGLAGEDEEGGGGAPQAAQPLPTQQEQQAQQHPHGVVNMEEAAQAVEAGRSVASHAATMDADSEGCGGGGGGGSADADSRRQAVVVDADRGTFEKILVLPTMLDDHLPDRYLEALQQL